MTNITARSSSPNSDGTQPAHVNSAGRGRHQTRPAWMTNTSALSSSHNSDSFSSAPPPYAPDPEADPIYSYGDGATYWPEQPRGSGVAVDGAMPDAMRQSSSRDPRLHQRPNACIDLSSTEQTDTFPPPAQLLLPQPPAPTATAHAGLPDDGRQLPPAATKRAKRQFIAAHSRKEWNDLTSNAQRQLILRVVQQEQEERQQQTPASNGSYLGWGSPASRAASTAADRGPGAAPAAAPASAASVRRSTSAQPGPLQLEKQAMGTSAHVVLLQIVQGGATKDVGWMEVKRMDPTWGADWQFRIPDALVVRSRAYKKVSKHIFEGKPYSILSAVGETALRRFPQFAKNRLPALSADDSAHHVMVASIGAEGENKLYLRIEDDQESAKLYHFCAASW